MMVYLAFLIVIALISAPSVSITYDEDADNPLTETYIYEGMTEFTFFADRVTWQEANIICPSYQGRLAVLDDVFKARFIGEALAETNIKFEGMWIGGRQQSGVWWWYTVGTVIPALTNLGGYPPWGRQANRESKQCLLMTRKCHDAPLFVDTDCRFRRPFICEKSVHIVSEKPVPTKWVHINESTYVIYHGRLTWMEAVSFCWQQGKRLAVIPNNDVANTLGDAMTHSRPDFENIWIGATNQFLGWAWLSTGESLSMVIGEDGYPPWRIEPMTRRSKLCLLLDRHRCDHSVFIDTACDRKRDFVCEHYTGIDNENWIDKQINFQHDNRSMVINVESKPWGEATLICQSRGSYLVTLDTPDTMNAVIDAMANHPKELVHAWIGGNVLKDKQWHWVKTGEVIKPRNSKGFPPWYEDSLETSLRCLNLDRKEDSKPTMYGLTCFSHQPYVCEIDCKNPGIVDNGDWTCTPAEPPYINTCTLTCHPGHVLFGSATMKCKRSAWISQDKTNNNNMFPKCLKMCDMASNILKTINHYDDASGFLFVIDSATGAQDIFVSALQFMAAIITAFPLSPIRPAGLISLTTTPNVIFPYNEEDSCALLKKIQDNVSSRTPSVSTVDTFDTINNQINSMQRGRKTIIFYMSSADRSSWDVSSKFTDLDASGHSIFSFLVGLPPLVDLGLLASVGPLYATNHYAIPTVNNLTQVAVFMMSDKINALDDCAVTALVPGMNLKDIEFPRWVLLRVTNATLPEIRASYKLIA